ncbi:MAG TPA: hypothetical protein VD999_00425 [Vitreimonas sp.]|nr:hypothetical protein [Vitreimonas sp.]
MLKVKLHKEAWQQAGAVASDRISEFDPQCLILSGASAEISNFFLSCFIKNLDAIDIIRFNSQENWWLYRRDFGRTPRPTFRTIGGKLIPPHAWSTTSNNSAADEILRKYPGLPQQVNQKCRQIDHHQYKRIVNFDDYRSTISYKARQFPVSLMLKLNTRPNLESLYITGESALTDVLYYKLSFYRFIENWASLLTRLDSLNIETDQSKIDTDLQKALTDLHEEAKLVLS